MPAVTTLIDPSGTEWALDGSLGIWEGRGKKGFHAPSYQHYRDESPTIAGAFWRGVRALPRELFLPIVIRDVNRDVMLAKRRALIRAISPIKGECTIESAWPDGSVRSIKCRYVDGMDAGEQGPGEFGITTMRYGLRFVADDPYTFGDIVNQQWDFNAATRTELPIPGADTFYEVVSSSYLVNPLPGAPLNANSGFETVGPSGWTGVGGALTQDLVVFSTGIASGKLVPDGVTANARIQSSQVAVNPAGAYIATGSLRCANSRTVNLNVNWYTSAAVYISTTSYSLSVTANTWTPFSTVMISPYNAGFASVIPTLPGSSVVGDVLYADDTAIGESLGSTVYNPGDVDTYPTWTLSGPFTQVTIANAASNKSFTLVHTLPVGDKLFIVTDPGSSYIVDGAGVNRWNTLQAGYELWPLVSGYNPLSVSISSAVSGATASMTFRSRYEAD